MPGAFIVLEGPDGAGTSTHSALLAQSLENRGFSTVLTAEATDGPIGLFIRTCLHDPTISLTALQLLFCADRAAHSENVLCPAVERGQTVICDRYALSTVIYGGACGIDADWLLHINAVFPQPDLQILTLPPFETCRKRVQERTQDIFEAKQAFQRDVYERYAAHAAVHPDTLTIDTSGDTETTALLLADRVEAFLRARTA